MQENHLNSLQVHQLPSEEVGYSEQATGQHQEFESEEQLTKMANRKLSDEDLDVCRSSLTLLNEMKDAATCLEDMQGEVPTEIINACISMRKKMAKIVEAKSMFGGML